MNLVTDPWIPCMRQGGALRPASLQECFSEDIVDLAARPHERVALMRLLLCISYAALGVAEDYEAWEGQREKLPEAASAYLHKWRESFELFHPEKPFLQVYGLESAAKDGTLASCSKLDFALASGNNSTLFDHAARAERAFSPEWLALNLLTFQMFSPGGLVGVVQWGSKTTSKSSSDGPCAPSSMLHTFLRRATLLDSIHFNLVSEDELDAYKNLGEGWKGRPLWEAFPRDLEDKAAIRNATETFLGRMVPLSRAVWLSPRGGKRGVEMLLGNGLSYPSFTNARQPFPQEVSATVIASGKKEAHVLLGLQPGKALWRQLPALTVKRRNDTDLGGCAALVHCNEEADMDLVVCGMSRDQAEVVDTAESVFHVPGAMFQTEGHVLYENEVANAESLAQSLGFAIERYRQIIDGGWQGRLKLAGPGKGNILAQLKAQAFRHYWTAVEARLPLLWEMVRNLGNQDFLDAQKLWKDHLEKSAKEAFALVCGVDTERQMRAYVIGKKLLLGGIYKHVKPKKKGEQA